MTSGRFKVLNLTKKSSYAIIGMTHLARLEPATVASAREISQRFGISMSLLMNVLKELSAAGFVEAVRGAHGGYRLVQSPEEISMADIVTALEGPMRPAHCIKVQSGIDDNGVCDVVDRCPIADPVHRVHRKLSDFLKTLTLADIVERTAAPLKG